MDYISKDNLMTALERIYKVMSPTPTYKWPLLCDRIKNEVWLKHENYTPTGAFKIRGGINYVNELLINRPLTKTVVAASTGNHGQSIATAASIMGINSIIISPKNTSKGKVRSMKAQGANVIFEGNDFQESFEYALNISKNKDYHFIPSFHEWLVAGVATYAWEMFRIIEPKIVYVPIGLGSGCVGVISVKKILNLKTEIIGVQAAGAPSYALSFSKKKIISTPTINTIAEGLATRKPNEEAVKIINSELCDIITVTDEEIIEAQNIILADTHSLSEPAGAAGLAAIIKHKTNKSTLTILSGSNTDIKIN